MLFIVYICVNLDYNVTKPCMEYGYFYTFYQHWKQIRRQYTSTHEWVSSCLCCYKDWHKSSSPCGNFIYSSNRGNKNSIYYSVIWNYVLKWKGVTSVMKNFIVLTKFRVKNICLCLQKLATQYKELLKM